jgi:hypothetical protein
MQRIDGQQRTSSTYGAYYDINADVVEILKMSDMFLSSVYS